MTISTIYTTVPREGLDETQAAVFSALQELNIPFERVEHENADTMEDCVAIGNVLGADVCKNLVLCNRQKTSFYLLTMPGDKPFFTKDLSHQIGSSRLSFASPEAMEELLHVQPGSASILSLLFDREHRVQLVMDRETMEQEFFCCHPCKNTGTLKMKTSEVLRVFLKHTGHEPVTVDLPRYTEEN